MAYGTPYHSPQNVAPPVVGGDDAVGYEESRAAPVLCHYSHRLPHLVALLRVMAADLLHFANERQE